VQLLSTTAPSTSHKRVRTRSCRGTLMQWQRHLKTGAALGTFEDDDRAAERLHVVAHEGQPQPGTSRDTTVVRRAPAKETLEHLLALVGRHAETGVVDVNHEVLTVNTDANGDRVAGVVVRIIDEFDITRSKRRRSTLTMGSPTSSANSTGVALRP